jgi:hypothetical protein
MSIELEGHKQTTIIEGWIVNGQAARVAVSRSIPYYSSISMESVLTAADSTAIVTISDDMGNSEQLKRGMDLQNILRGDWGHLYIAGQLYIGSTIIGQAGHTYYLTVESNNQTYTAYTSIPNAVPQVDSLTFVRFPGDTTATLRLYWTDNPSTYDCYRFFVKIKGLDMFFKSVSMGCFDDLLFNGNHLAYEMLREPQTNMSYTSMSEKEREDFYRVYYKVGDTVYVRSTFSDTASYKYWWDLQTSISMGMTPFLEPSSLKTNIKGENVTGIWSGYNARYDTVIFR